jgi:hypothetical protein
MTITWQNGVTAGIVLVALGYLARCLVRLVRRKGLPGCGCCQKCPTETSAEPLVTFDQQPPK